MKVQAIAFVGLVALSACAKSPENIGAIPVAGEPYARFSCAQLAAEKLTVSQQLEVISAEQRNAQSTDTIGVLLIGLPISSISGNDQEAAIGVAKGRLQALDQRILARGC
ncbi:MAG: hypothetical protein ABJN52_00590 [Litorimonas sp.]